MIGYFDITWMYMEVQFVYFNSEYQYVYILRICF